MFVLRFFLFITYFTYLCIAEVRDTDITNSFVSSLLNSVFSDIKKNHVLYTNDNKTNIFNNGKRLFEVETPVTIIEKDFSINSPKGIKIKIFNDKSQEIINIVSEQFYENRKQHTLIFYGNVEINLLNYKTIITTDCLIYDSDSDVFFNTHKTNIVVDKNTIIDGISIFFKRDLSYLKIKSPKIINSTKSQYTI